MKDKIEKKEYKYSISVTSEEGKHNWHEDAKKDYGTGTSDNTGSNRKYSSTVTIGFDDPDDIPKINEDKIHLVTVQILARALANNDVDIQLKRGDGNFHQANELVTPLENNDDQTPQGERKEKKGNGGEQNGNGNATEKQINYLNVLMDTDPKKDFVTGYLKNNNLYLDDLPKEHASTLIQKLKNW